VSSGVFFEPLIEALAADHDVVAPDFRGYGGSERKAIDAARGLRDLSDDLAALIATLGLPTPIHLLGWSTGGGVIMQYAIDHPQHVAGLILESPMSPCGFGGTHGIDGRPNWPDHAGSGGGTVNPDFLRRLGEGDRGSDSPTSPLNTMRNFYTQPEFRLEPEFERRCLDGMLDTKTGADVYPGDQTVSENWPGVAPGTSGMNNALSPRYCDLTGFAALSPAPLVLWIRGDSDQIVSDTSLFDFGYLGKLGAVPGWPGDDVFPPQPMVSQLRAVLERGGNFREIVYEACGHTPHLEHPERFLADMRAFMR
ncbi:MAG: alpha/beta hydrolase, partial [Chloroflexi bacterium]|nr:alpha/beta hydrolase [Chloroflexota bacterium]